MVVIVDSLHPQNQSISAESLLDGLSKPVCASSQEFPSRENAISSALVIIVVRLSVGETSRTKKGFLESIAGYEPAEIEQFVSYMHKQLDTVEPEINREDLRRIFLDIYANPVVTKELLEKERITGGILL